MSHEWTINGITHLCEKCDEARYDPSAHPPPRSCFHGLHDGAAGVGRARDRGHTAFKGASAARTLRAVAFPTGLPGPAEELRHLFPGPWTRADLEDRGALRLDHGDEPGRLGAGGGRTRNYAHAVSPHAVYVEAVRHVGRGADRGLGRAFKRVQDHA